jgi:hypothetical protein
METHGPQGEPGTGWHGRRKRIVARDISANEQQRADGDSNGDSAAADVAHETRLAARQAIAPGELVDASYSPKPDIDSLIVDPTQLVGGRHRRHGANAKYRATQVSTGLSLLGATVAIAVWMFDDEQPGVAESLATAGLVLAIMAIYFVRTSRLAYRLRGYAAAAGVLAALALALSLLPNPFHEEPAQTPTVTRPDADPTP